MPPSPFASCPRHPSARAGWQCTGCETFLCPECVEARRFNATELLVCRRCGERAETLRVHRSQLLSFARRLGSSWHYLLHPQAAVFMLLLASVLTFFDVLTVFTSAIARPAIFMLGQGLFWSGLFTVMRSSARGETELPMPEYEGFFEHWLLPAFRGLVATSVVWLPLGLYLVYGSGWDAHAYRERTLADPMFYTTGRMDMLPWGLLLGSPVAWGLGLVGLLWFPLALMLGVASPSTLNMLNPLQAVAVMRRLGRDYVLALAALLPLGLLFVAAEVGGVLLRAGGMSGGVLTWLAELLSLPAPLMGARVLGVLLYTRGDEFGQLDTAEFLTPVLPDAAPSTSLRVEDMGVTAPSAEQSFPDAMGRVHELDEAVRTRDVPAALSLYAELDSLPRARITPAAHLFVGQAAATYGDLPLAVRALEAAADVAPEDPLAPRALVLLARVLGERMQESSRAQDVYRYIVDRYPETDASRFARTHLPPTS